MKKKMKNPVSTSHVHLEIVWVDGRGAKQKMAKHLAQKAYFFKMRKVAGLELCHAGFLKNQFQLAGEIFDLVGRTATTKIRARGQATIDKSWLSYVLDCYRASLRSRKKDYCSAVVRLGGPNDMGIGIHLSTYGIHTLKDRPLKKKPKPKIHPCKLCYSFLPYEERETFEESLLDQATDNHAILCPKFKPT